MAIEKGFALFRRGLLTFERRRPFDVDWDALPVKGSGSFNEVRVVPSEQAAALGVDPSTPLVIRRTLVPTSIDALVVEAYLTRRMAILKVAPTLYASWLEREGDGARLYLIMRGFERSLHDVLKERDLTAPEEAQLQRFLHVVADSGVLLLDLKPANVVHTGDQLALIDFGARHTVKVSKLSTESRELLHTALLVSIAICTTGRVILRSRLMELANDPMVRFLDEKDAPVGALWSRLQSQFSHYLRKRGCLAEGQSPWAYIMYHAT